MHTHSTYKHPSTVCITEVMTIEIVPLLVSYNIITFTLLLYVAMALLSYIIQICVHNISIIFVCGVHRDWCFEAFVVPGAGDDLLSSAAGKPRYVQLKMLR